MTLLQLKMYPVDRSDVRQGILSDIAMKIKQRPQQHPGMSSGCFLPE